MIYVPPWLTHSQTHTERQTHRHADGFWPAILLAQPAVLKVFFSMATHKVGFFFILYYILYYSCVPVSTDSASASTDFMALYKCCYYYCCHVIQFNCLHVDGRICVYIICVCTYIFVYLYAWVYICMYVSVFLLPRFSEIKWILLILLLYPWRIFIFTLKTCMGGTAFSFLTHRPDPVLPGSKCVWYYSITKRCQVLTCGAVGMESNVYITRRLAGVQTHATLVAVRATVGRAHGRHLSTTGVTTATHRSSQLVQVTAERRRTPEAIARICRSNTQSQFAYYVKINALNCSHKTSENQQKGRKFSCCISVDAACLIFLLCFCSHLQ